MQKNFNPVYEYTMSEQEAAKLRMPVRQLTPAQLAQLKNLNALENKQRSAAAQA